MVKPHPVGAPYSIQLFSHLAYVFGRIASLPKFFLPCQSPRSKCLHICYAPTSPTHAYRLQYSCISRFFLPIQSIRNHFPDHQVILRQYCIHDTYFLHWHFPFVFIFWVFYALHFQLMYWRMIALIPCQTGSQSHDPSCSNTFSVCWSNF